MRMTQGLLAEARPHKCQAASYSHADTLRQLLTRRLWRDQATVSLLPRKVSVTDQRSFPSRFPLGNQRVYLLSEHGNPKSCIVRATSSRADTFPMGYVDGVTFLWFFLSSLCTLVPPRDAKGRRQSGQICIQLAGERGGILVGVLPALSLYEGRAAVGKPSPDDLLHTGPAEHRGQSCTIDTQGGF